MRINAEDPIIVLLSEASRRIPRANGFSENTGNTDSLLGVENMV